MNLLDLAVNGDDKWKVWSARTKKPVAAPVKKYAWDTNYVAPASTTATYQPAPVPQRTIADYAPPPTYWNSSGDLKINYAGGDPYSYDSRRYNGRVIRDMQNQREWDAAKNIGAFGLSVLSDPIALGMSAFDFAKDPSWFNAGALGLDAITPGNVGGFLKGIGEIGIGTAAARELGRKTIGRIATNLVSPVGYDNKFRDIFGAFNTRGLKSVINDVPLYPITHPDREFPYRVMFGLPPRTINKYEILKDGTVYNDSFYSIQGSKGNELYDTYGKNLRKIGELSFPTRNPDGTYMPTKEGDAYDSLLAMPASRLEGIDLTQNARIGRKNNPLFGGFSMDWDAANRTLTANDRWDFDLHSGELKEVLKTFFANDGVSLKTKFSSRVIPTALRYAMSKITDPITYKVPIKLEDMRDWTRQSMEEIIGDQYLQKWGRPPVRKIDKDLYDDFPF